ncbi:MAG: aminotransferase class III-fold pyridoxal phosphate-dependent enzyme [Chloroflexi bacterium]|nr:aminotransferase class III-fold pyridoxal phosphate-dependent enzyme [Chloroflexota bacterium]
MTILHRYVESHPNSCRLAERANTVFPNGVTHDIRHNAPFSLYVQNASGSRKTDVDGNQLLDYVMGHGALLLGHNHPSIVEAVARQLPLGTHYGASHEAEIRWGELVLGLVPSAERVRFTSSGTEATMMALRLARAHTGREKVLRLREHFHGWNDSVTGQPPSEGTMPVSPGLPHGTLEGSIVVPQNDVDILERTLREDGSEIAVMILEPTGAHWGTEPIDVEFVRAARDLTARHGVLLIFDEVITGFRVSPGGAQQAYGITPDMTTMAKIVAGGLPGGCVGGRTEIIDQIAIRDSESREYVRGERISHPGTFNANPVSAAAGAACLALIGDGEQQRRAAETAEALARALNGVLREESVAGCVYGYSSMLHIAIGANDKPPDGYSWGGAAPKPIAESPRGAAHALKLGMINEGVHLMDTGMMVSSAHTPEDVAITVEAFRNTLRAMKVEGIPA